MAGDETPFRSATDLPLRPRVILYGAGNVGRDVAAAIRASGGSVRCYLDQRAEPEERRADLPVLRPEAPELSEADRSLPVVVSIFNREVDTTVIARRLAGLGFRNVFSFVDVHERYARELGDRFWLTGRKLYEEASTRTRMSEARALFVDDSSATLFDALLAFRRTASFASLPDPQLLSAPYVPRDVPSWPWSTAAVLVDGGAYDGDTIEGLLAAGMPLRSVCAFEPEPDSFRKLSERAARWRDSVPGGVLLWPSAVSDSTGSLSFSIGKGESSHVTSDGETRVSCVALDDVLSGVRPDVVKLDIEGAEPEALLGARRLIETHRPRLAICVYHRPDHLWEIPRLLASWGLGYRLHLRSHGFNGFDLVLYAVPAA